MPLRIALLALLSLLILVAGSLSSATAQDAPIAPIVEDSYVTFYGDTDFVHTMADAMGRVMDAEPYAYFHRWASEKGVGIRQVERPDVTWAVQPVTWEIEVGGGLSEDPRIRSMHMFQSMVYLWVLDTYGYCPGTGYVAMSYAYLYGESIGVDGALLDFKWAGLESIKPKDGVLLPCQ